MSERRCPEHRGTGITPKDITCHNHVGVLQQRFHNMHCRALKCPFALNSAERHVDAPTHFARSTVEFILWLVSG